MAPEPRSWASESRPSRLARGLSFPCACSCRACPGSFPPRLGPLFLRTGTLSVCPQSLPTPLSGDAPLLLPALDSCAHTGSEEGSSLLASLRPPTLLPGGGTWSQPVVEGFLLFSVPPHPGLGAGQDLIKQCGEPPKVKASMPSLTRDTDPWPRLQCLPGHELREAGPGVWAQEGGRRPPNQALGVH